MRRQHVNLFSPAMQRDLDLVAYGHDGLPVLVFPSSEGSAADYESFGMIGALSSFIENGKLRLYCVSSYDSESWWARHRPAHERAWRHSLYEDWIINQVVPAIARDVDDDAVRLVATGCSFGAFHAANFTLKHPQRFHHALCLSGAYDIRWLLDGHHDDWVYFNNPVEYVPHLHGQALDDIRRNVFITLVSGQGQWEERSLSSTREFWWLLREKNIPNYMHLWGHDVAHDWQWWRKQAAHYLGKLVEEDSPWPST